MSWAAIFLATAILAADPGQDAALKSLAAEGDRTLARFSTEGATWVASHRLPGTNATMEVIVERFPTTERRRLRLVIDRQPYPIATIISQDGAWYVDDGRTRGKYRPYEAAFEIPIVTYFLAASELTFFTQSMLRASDVVSLEEKGSELAIVRLRVNDDLAVGLRQLIFKVEELAATLESSASKVPAGTLQDIETVKDALALGIAVHVDRSNGVVLRHGLPPKLFGVRNFDWLGQSPSWTVNPSEWQDHTSPFSQQELEDVIQIGHSAIWQPGTPTTDTDLVLLNVRNGKTKRVPFPLGVAATGCFTSDRSKLIVPGLDNEYGNLTLFQIDLTTAVAARMESKILRQGIWMRPAVSPNGELVAAMQVMQGQGLSSQLHVIDSKSLESRTVGPPQDVRLVGWHPDGNALICELRHPGPSQEVPKASLMLLSLDGKQQELREGRGVCFLPAERRLLYEDDERRKWTCDLAGKNERPFGDGFVPFGFPTASADGRMVMMRFEKGKAPTPYLIDTKTFEASPIPVAQGLWVMPSW